MRQKHQFKIGIAHQQLVTGFLPNRWRDIVIPQVIKFKRKAAFFDGILRSFNRTVCFSPRGTPG